MERVSHKSISTSVGTDLAVKLTRGPLKTRTLISLVFLIAVTSPMRLTAQTASAIEGTVLDSRGQAIVGAEIIVIGPVLAREIKITSDLNGSYRVLGLQPGVYELRVTKSGFAEQIYRGLAVTVNRLLVFD